MKKSIFLVLGGVVVVVGSVACGSGEPTGESVGTSESAYTPDAEAEVACEGPEIVIPYVDPDLDYAEDGSSEEPVDPSAGDAGIVLVEAPLDPSAGDASIQPADRPRPPPAPPKPPVCKPKTTNCNVDNQALKPECRGGVKDALYKKQKEICGTERSCKKTDTPEELATKLKRNEHCKDLRVQVRNCYIDKCQAGHVIAIAEAIAAMANCQLLIAEKKK